MSEYQQQPSLSETKSDLYLPDECWECVFRFLNNGHDRNNSSLKSLCAVSKQFLSITNRLQFSISISDPTSLCLSRLFQRFPNLTSLCLTHYYRDDSSLASSIRMKCTQNSVDNSNSLFVSPQLKSLHLISSQWLRDKSFKMIASVFPNLQLFNLSYCFPISEEGIFQVLRTCSELRHLNLTGLRGWKLHGMNFEVPKLEVLNLSYTNVNDKTLCVISKCCRGLLQLLLELCYLVTQKGVKYVLEKCTQLREINLKRCVQVDDDVLTSLIFSRPSLRKLTSPYGYRFSDREMELLSRQGCIVC
ncbi:F-box/LRR protein [Medicago truncatula]|uniref:F-box/LRR protein n=2 Tax=Medicago truncatula TaxID=3880 RepID=A0A072UFV7_MEDTR|nr:F-box/LRR protein [Medicago truncatula]